MNEEVLGRDFRSFELKRHLLISFLIIVLIGSVILMFGVAVNNLKFPILSTLIFFPVISAFLIALIPRDREELIKFSALVVSIIEFILSIPLYLSFNKNTAEMQFKEEYLWIPQWGIKYSVGVDGI
ncbi:MAG: NADH-quinone oxidoreductase subunit M, partial [Thermodesulfovibrio sp.]|nr:NADH-quinone oxidoreductase subunit M [Thermodesulfovibrio sp.]